LFYYHDYLGAKLLNITNLQYQHNNTDNTYTYSLEVKPQEIVGILGQSGSGKSTLLDLIAGFIEPSSGSVVLEQKELLSLTVEQRPISILFQNHNLFEHLSVHKNIMLGINEKDNGKIQDILKSVDLEAFENTLSSKLSGGQQQRVALARVLMCKEPILLLDEPFTGLDEKTRSSMLDLVQKITTEHNLHTIMVTHDVQDCDRIASHVYKMQENTLIKQ
jgi:thiamine transport system ATP-binding protein